MLWIFVNIFFATNTSVFVNVDIHNRTSRILRVVGILSFIRWWWYVQSHIEHSESCRNIDELVQWVSLLISISIFPLVFVLTTIILCISLWTHCTRHATDRWEGRGCVWWKCVCSEGRVGERGAPDSVHRPTAHLFFRNTRSTAARWPRICNPRQTFVAEPASVSPHPWFVWRTGIVDASVGWSSGSLRPVVCCQLHRWRQNATGKPLRVSNTPVSGRVHIRLLSFEIVWFYVRCDRDTFSRCHLHQSEGGWVLWTGTTSGGGGDSLRALQCTSFWLELLTRVAVLNRISFVLSLFWKPRKIPTYQFTLIGTGLHLWKTFFFCGGETFWVMCDEGGLVW